MKRSISLLVCLLLVATLFLLPTFTPTALATGYGSNGKFLAPIEAPVAESIPISNRAELEAIKNNLNGNYHLTQDIDLSGGEWVPIGDSSNSFRGTFDGQGYVINNLTFTGETTEQHVGLFGYVRGGYIKNVGLEGTIIDIFSSSNSLFAGGICGYIAILNPTPTVTISNCYNMGSVSSSVSSSPTSVSYSHVGGICGYITNSNATIKDCYNMGSVSASAGSDSSISGYSYAGGICAYINNGANYTSVTINNCYNSGLVSSSASTNSSSTSRAGGICAFISSTWNPVNINNCYNSGSISSSASSSHDAYSYIGGICGEVNFSRISNCYNMSSLFSSSLSPSSANTIFSYGGGICGYISGSSSLVSNCYNVGSVFSSASYSSFAGGICGSGYSSTSNFTTSNCIVLSDEIHAFSSKYATSCLIGNYSTKENNLALTSISSVAIDDSDGSITYAQAKSKATYEASGWDFNTVWDISPSENSGYPYLQGVPPVIDDGTEINGGVEIDFYLRSVGKYIKLNVNWSDDFFSKNATMPSSDLAIASLALAEAAYRENDVINTLRTFGFTNFDSFYNYSDDDLDRVAHIFASKRILVNGRTCNIVAIVCRGTTGISEWASNSNAFPGFRTATTRLEDNLAEYISALTPAQDIKFLITGHSRGAAVSNLLGAEITGDYGENNVYTYCFATPNTTFLWSKLAYGNIINIHNENDIVCWVPPLYVKHGISAEFNLSSKTVMSDVKSRFKQLTGVEYKNSIPFNHYPETYLSYLLVTKTITTSATARVKVVTIKCPVDVEVYDSSENLVGRVVNNVIDDTVDMVDNGIFIWLEGDEKYLLLPLDEEYIFKTTGTESGMMDYSVGYADLDTWDMLEEKEFNQVQLYDGKLMTSIVSSMIDIPDVQLLIIDNAGITGKILADGTEIPFTNAEAVYADTGALTWNIIKGSNTAANNVASDLTLPTVGAHGSAIAWSSNNQEVISNVGAVTRPAYGSGGAEVTLTATISQGTESNSVEFNLTVEALVGVALSGQITYQSSFVPATVTLYDSDGNLITSADTAADGSYTFTAPEGTGYTLVITKPGYLSYTIKNLSLTDGEEIEEIDIRLLAGDVNGDGVVNAVDLTYLLSEFNKAPVNYPYADIDGNGIVNAVDLTYLLAGFNKRNIVIDKMGDN